MQKSRSYFVYILASRPRGTLYIGLSNNLHRRVIEHREQRCGFTGRYNVTQLMWYEQHSDIHAAIQREKSLKLWPRAWKTNLIEQTNPHWQDLFPAIERGALD